MAPWTTGESSKKQPLIDYTHAKYAARDLTEEAGGLTAEIWSEIQTHFEKQNIEGYDDQTLINMINRTLQGAMNEERYYIVKKMLDNMIDNLKHVLGLLQSTDTLYAKWLYKSLLNHQKFIDLEFKRMIQKRAAAASALDNTFNKMNLDDDNNGISQAGSGISQAGSGNSKGGGKRTKYRRKNTRKSKRQGKSNKRRRGKSKRRR